MTLLLPDDLAKRIEAIAQRENRDPLAVIESMVTNYEPVVADEQITDVDDPLEKILGVLDTDITDLSTSVSDTRHPFYRDRYADTD